MAQLANGHLIEFKDYNLDYNTKIEEVVTPKSRKHPRVGATAWGCGSAIERLKSGFENYNSIINKGDLWTDTSFTFPGVLYDDTYF